jgi:hypothetical protein
LNWTFGSFCPLSLRVFRQVIFGFSRRFAACGLSVCVVFHWDFMAFLVAVKPEQNRTSMS